jgi:hypothetical protein
LWSSMPLIYLSCLSSCFLEPKPLSWLSYSPPSRTLSCKHLFLASLLQHCYNMSLHHLHSNLCLYFGFCLIFYCSPKDHPSIQKKRKGGPLNIL